MKEIEMCVNKENEFEYIKKKYEDEEIYIKIIEL